MPIRKATSIPYLGLAVLLTGMLSLTGCSRKERVVDFDAPGVRIKVDRDKDSGAVDVNVDRNKKH